jgi:hypothetical protein
MCTARLNALDGPRCDTAVTAVHCMAWRRARAADAGWHRCSDPRCAICESQCTKLPRASRPPSGTRNTRHLLYPRKVGSYSLSRNCQNKLSTGMEHFELCGSFVCCMVSTSIYLYNANMYYYSFIFIAETFAFLICNITSPNISSAHLYHLNFRHQYLGFISWRVTRKVIQLQLFNYYFFDLSGLLCMPVSYSFFRQLVKHSMCGSPKSPRWLRVGNHTSSEFVEIA